MRSPLCVGCLKPSSKNLISLLFQSILCGKQTPKVSLFALYEATIETLWLILFIAKNLSQKNTRNGLFQKSATDFGGLAFLVSGNEPYICYYRVRGMLVCVNVRFLAVTEVCRPE